MARRNPNALSDLLAIAVRLPPWASLGIAVVTHVLLRWIAAFEVPATARMEDLGDMILRLAFVIFAQFGQYVLPLVFVSGAVLSFVKQRRSGRLLDTFGRGAHGDHAAPWSPTWREFEMLVGELYRLPDRTT